MVSRELPFPLPPHSQSPQALRDSRDTPHPHSHLLPTLYPNHLHFGDPLPSPKPDSLFQVGFCNIGGLPAIAQHNKKVLDIKYCIVSKELDLFGSCKSNLNWKCLPEHIQLKEWFWSADGCCMFAANNVHEWFGKFQFGGTFWIAAGHATSHIAHTDKDPTNLGRWVSCSLKGHSGKGLTIIFAYHPCSNSATRFRSVYAQHHQHLLSINWMICPHTTFLDALTSFVLACQDAGDGILILGNMNSNIWHFSLQSYMLALELHELILSQFPHLPIPATFKHSEHSGKTPIDGT